MQKSYNEVANSYKVKIVYCRCLKNERFTLHNLPTKITQNTNKATKKQQRTNKPKGRQCLFAAFPEEEREDKGHGPGDAGHAPHS